MDRSLLHGRVRFVSSGYFLGIDISNLTRKRISIIIDYERRAVSCAAVNCLNIQDSDDFKMCSS
jgi:hypothetical protein